MSPKPETVIKLVEIIDQQKENRIRPKKKVNHIHTKTTRSTEAITDKMSAELEVIARDIATSVSRNRNISIDKIRKKHSTDVGSIIATGIRESYLLGLHFMEKFGERTIRLTEQATADMNKQIDETKERFWTRVAELIQIRNTAREKQKIAGSAGTPLDLALFNSFNNYFANTALTMNYFALNSATIHSQRELFREDIEDAGISVTGSVQVPKLIWVTRKDNKVDEICLNLEGRTWDADDPELDSIYPAHFGCRCRLLPLDKGGVFNA